VVLCDEGFSRIQCYPSSLSKNEGALLFSSIHGIKDTGTIIYASCFWFVLLHTTRRNSMTKVFNSCFTPSSFIQDHILRDGRITQPEESPAEMVERVVEAIYREELHFSEEKTAQMFAEQVGTLMDNESIVFSTPVMTNAGRKDVARPLSACTVPPINLRSDIEMIRNQIDTYHQEAMGTGFNFDDTNDPVAMLLFLNDIAVKGSENGKEDRPVGNMGICGIDHPRIVEFITSKMLRREHLWKFNISVNTPESFWIAVRENSLWTLKNGDTIHA
jgi:ribonucleoside-diphosphate reductase alpha chain